MTPDGDDFNPTAYDHLDRDGLLNEIRGWRKLSQGWAKDNNVLRRENDELRRGHALPQTLEVESTGPVGPDSHIVTADHGPAHSGLDECFYCAQPIGEEHLFTCTMRRRNVILDVHLKAVWPVPESWGKAEIENHYNYGTWCSDKLFEALIKDIGETGACTCPGTTITYIGDDPSA